MVHCAKVATEFRQKFRKDVVIDMFCYRRFGHNEGDEPTFTQPLMYQKIRAHESTLTIYGKRLVAEGLLSESDVAAAREEQALPRLERGRLERRVGRLRERRRAEQPPFQVVSPAVHRADDVLRVAAAFEQQGLAVAAHVRQQVHAARAAHQRLAVPRPLEGEEVARVRDHQLVADVAGPRVEERRLLAREDLRVEVRGHRQLRPAGGEADAVGDVGHCASPVTRMRRLFHGPRLRAPAAPSARDCLRRGARLI